VGVKAAADFAIGEQSKQTGRTLKLLGVTSAERQIVAGLNYRLCLDLEENGPEARARHRLQ
jgi:hypothetical protein